MSQLERIKEVLIILKNQNKSLDQVNYEYLKQYLIEQEIKELYSIYYLIKSKEDEIFKMEKGYVVINKPYIKINKHKKKEIKETTPYIVLGIQAKEYSKEELLQIIGKKINFIKDHYIDQQQMKFDIDKILDTYNMIMKTSSKKR